MSKKNTPDTPDTVTVEIREGGSTTVSADLTPVTPEPQPEADENA